MTINRANEEATSARNGFLKEESHVLKNNSKLLICYILAPEEINNFFNFLCLFNPTLVKSLSSDFFFNSKILLLCF